MEQNIGSHCECKFVMEGYVMKLQGKIMLPVCAGRENNCFKN